MAATVVICGDGVSGNNRGPRIGRPSARRGIGDRCGANRTLPKRTYTVRHRARPELTRSSIHQEHEEEEKDQPRSGDPTSNTKRAVQAVGLGALMACAVAVPAAERTVSVVETVQLATTASRTWGAIKDFGAWQAWHPAFARTDLSRGDGHATGSVRVLTTKDGAKFTEELVAFDAAAHSYQYRIVESPAPVVGYVSTIGSRRARRGRAWYGVRPSRSSPAPPTPTPGS